MALPTPKARPPPPAWIISPGNKRMFLVNGEYVWYEFVGEDNGTLEWHKVEEAAAVAPPPPPPCSAPGPAPTMELATGSPSSTSGSEDSSDCQQPGETFDEYESRVNFPPGVQQPSWHLSEWWNPGTGM